MKNIEKYLYDIRIRLSALGNIPTAPGGVTYAWYLQNYLKGPGVDKKTPLPPWGFKVYGVRGVKLKETDVRILLARRKQFANVWQNEAERSVIAYM